MRRAEMRRLLALATIALLAVGLFACGGSDAGGSSRVSSVSDPDDVATTVTTSETSPVPLDSRVDGDKDNDIGAPNDDTNNNSSFGHAANLSERRAITALLKRYYATALAGNGARGCSMLYSTLAEAAVEDDAQPPGPVYMRGAKTCAAVMTLLFKHYHAQLAAELPKLRVTHVRLEEHHGIAFLSFGALPERQISVVREGHTWKLNTIYDQELP
jgi:hypothetical protein